MTENEIGTIVVGTAIEIHRVLGTGLLKSVDMGYCDMESE
jgi:hypothetical protein